MAHKLLPPPSVVDLVKDDSRSDITWKNWLNEVYEAIDDMSTGDPWITHAIQNIEADYGVTVSLEAKNKDLLKFGRCNMIKTANLMQTVEIYPTGGTLENETFVTTNAIDSIVSSSTADIAANSSSDVTIEGHTVSGGVYTFVTQPAVLAGQTPVLLTTPLARVTRVYNNDSADFTGSISVYESAVTTITAGVPSAGYTGVHLTTRAGKNNSEKCSTTLSDSDYWVVTGVYGDVITKSSEDIEFEFQVRLKDKVFRTWFEFTAKDGTGTFRSAAPYIVIPPNSDIRIRAANDGTVAGDCEVSAGIFGALLTA